MSFYTHPMIASNGQNHTTFLGNRYRYKKFPSQGGYTLSIQNYGTPRIESKLSPYQHYIET